MIKSRKILIILLVLAIFTAIGTSIAQPTHWQREWPNTDFSRHSVEFDEIMSGGPPKDGIPSIDSPKFTLVEALGINEIGSKEPVLGIVINGQARALI